MKLADYMRVWDSQSFQFGSLDCFKFAAGAVEVTTGKNHMSDFGAYNDETSAFIALMEKFGTVDLRAVFVRVALDVGAVKVQPFEKMDGDIACIRWPAGLFRRSRIDQSCGLGVVYNDQIWGATAKGIVAIPANLEVLDIWRFE